MLSHLQVGLQDVTGGLTTMTTAGLNNALAYFSSVRTFNLAVLIIGFGMAIFYILGIMRPLLAYVYKESREVGGV